MPPLTMKFELSVKEFEAFQKFKRHRCPKKRDGYNPIPQFLFSPTAMGDGVELICPCGKRKDITDLSSW